mmetsp:Transcript_10877/g.14149  ORF Transcript_10877/g.14149 Transcript_10877/m.14149 type:complete len:526 (-) Transcript_10877:90-1667(-)
MKFTFHLVEFVLFLVHVSAFLQQQSFGMQNKMKREKTHETDPLIPQNLSERPCESDALHSSSMLFSRLEELYGGTGTLPTSWKRRRDSFPSGKYTKILERQKFHAKINLIYTILKPLLALFLVIAGYAARKNFIAVSLLSVFALLVLKDLWDDDVWMISFGANRYDARPRIIMNEVGDMEKIVNQSKLYYFSYSSPKKLLSGDWRTLLPSVTGQHQPNFEYQRFYVPSFDGEYLGLDFSFPLEFSTEKPLVFFSVGIGGGPNAGYILENAEMFLSKGWSVCVLVPKGMVDTQVENLKNIFDPAELRDIHQTLKILSGEFPTIYLMGFSLGGNTLFNYLARYGHEVPSSCKGSLAISSSIKHSYVSWKRYQNVYQRLLIPGIIEDFLSKYEDKLEELLSPAGVESLCQSQSYKDLHDTMMSKLRGKEFKPWLESTESADFLSNVAIPMLVLTALDDPLHHPDMIGTEYIVPSGNGNVAVWLTSQGGHVGWPEAKAESKGKKYAFILKVAEAYFQSIQSNNQEASDT